MASTRGSTSLAGVDSFTLGVYYQDGPFRLALRALEARSEARAAEGLAAFTKRAPAMMRSSVLLPFSPAQPSPCFLQILLSLLGVIASYFLYTYELEGVRDHVSAIM